MRSFRQRPVGWRHESYRHYLAAKGISTSMRDTRHQSKYLAGKGISSKRFNHGSSILGKHNGHFFYNSDKVSPGQSIEFSPSRTVEFSPGQSVEFNSRGYKVSKVEGDLVLIERQGVSLWVPVSSVSPIGAVGYYAGKDDRFDSSKASPDQSFGKRYFSKIGDEEQSLWSEFGNLREEEDELLDKPQTAQVKNDLEEVRRAIADAKGRLKVFEKRRMADPDVYYAGKDNRFEKGFEGISPEDKVFIRGRLIDAEKVALATVDDSLKKGEITEAQADKQRLEVMRIIAENRRHV